MRLHRLLPVLSIERFPFDPFDRFRVEAVDGDAVAVRIGARCVETLHATRRAERVLCLMRIERVRRKIGCALNEFEVRARHNEVMILFLRAYAAAESSQATLGLRLA